MSMDNRFSRLERTTYTGQCTPADVPELARQLLRGFHVAVGVEAARGLRKVLSMESALPVDAVVAAGAVPLLVLCLDQTHSTELQVMSGSTRAGRMSCFECYTVASVVSRANSGTVHGVDGSRRGPWLLVREVLRSRSVHFELADDLQLLGPPV